MTDEFTVCGSILFTKPVDHLLVGFLFDATGRRGTYFLYRFVMPLYTEHGSVVLNYSTRILHADRNDVEFELGERDIGKVCDEAIAAIEAGKHLEIIHDARTPAGFLRYLEHIGQLQWKLPSHLADIGFTYVLCGMLDDARAAFEQMLEETRGSGTWLHLRPHVEDTLNSLENGPDFALAKIAAWEDASRAAILMGSQSRRRPATIADRR